MLIEIHMLKNYPPVNLNRDDSGAPKSCFFGGVQRGRISSQCLKRSWRISDIFKDLGSYGIRTRHMPELVAKRLVNMGVSEKFIKEVKKVLADIANKKEKAKKEGITNQIIFYAEDELDRLALHIKDMIEKDGSLKEFKNLKPKDMELIPITADIALFGRMVTTDYFADVDASMQVAHAISTHAVNLESDYFTAVDDLLQGRDENGAGMIGDIDYNSCCYYEYASLDTDSLCHNLQNIENYKTLVSKLIPVLLRAMTFSNPSGKQNTFAGQVFPDFIMIECKKDKIPLSYVNAFEEPVSTWGNKPQIVKKSIDQLLDYINCMDEAYELPLVHRICFSPKKYQGENCLRKGEWLDKFSELEKACGAWIDENGEG